MPNPHVKQVVTCANCGVQKGETNHWFVISNYAGPTITSFAISVFNPKVELTPEDLPACGRSCATVLLGRWFDAH